MSGTRSAFFSRRSSREHSNSGDPLLSQGINSIDLNDLSPRPSVSPSCRDISPSPPPSFYHQSQTSSTSPQRTKTSQRRIQFANPPPPIVSSVLLPSAQRPSSSSGANSKKSLSASILGSRKRGDFQAGGTGLIDPLLALERRERAFQKDLQLLLDAQAAGLVHGFGGGPDRQVDGSSDAGSSTPTDGRTRRSRSGTSNIGAGGVVPVRQPKRKAVGLRAARRGLLRDMRELVGVKAEEEIIVVEQIERREDILAKVTEWEGRIEGVKGKLHGDPDGEGSGGEEVREIAELRNEEQAVDMEIRDMEDRLLQMRARKKWLGERILEGINRRESRLSSYRGALKEVEREVKDFLNRPPITPSPIMGDEEGFMALPAHRRTLDMANEWWKREISQLQLRKSEVEKEKLALEQGARIWEDTFKMVNEFEDGLRKEMASEGKDKDAEMLRNQVHKMGAVIEKLEKNAKVAVERGWNLLICAVGAELEAFREGIEILNGALETYERSNKARSIDGDRDSQDYGESTNGHNGLDDLNSGPDRNGMLERDDSDEDGPNFAELLVDHGDR